MPFIASLWNEGRLDKVHIAQVKPSYPLSTVLPSRGQLEIVGNYRCCPQICKIIWNLQLRMHMFMGKTNCQLDMTNIFFIQ